MYKNLIEYIMNNSGKVKNAEIVSKMIVNAVKDNLSQKEIEELKERLLSVEDIEELVSRVSSHERQSYLYEKVALYSKEDKVLILRNEINMRKKVELRKRLTLIITSCAAAILSISFLLNDYFKLNSDNIDSELIVSNIDTTIPMLITNDGEAIALNSEVNNKVNKEMITHIDSTTISYYNKENITHNDEEGLELNTLIVPAKYTYRITLSDSTTVSLNANSKLKYPDTFIGDERVVELEGEAYFDVTKSDKPFIVRVKDGEIKVYGTEFNIYSRNESPLEAVLVKGKIGFKDKNNSEVIMNPGEWITLIDDIIHKRNVDVNDYILWQKRMFIYKNRTLNRVLSDLEQWYGVKIEVNDKDIYDIELTMVTSQDENVNNILDFISEIIDVKFIREGKEDYTVFHK